MWRYVYSTIRQYVIICHLTTMDVPISYPLMPWTTPGSFGNFRDVHVACWDLPGANLGAKTSCKWGYISTPTSRVKEPQEIPPIFEPFYWGSNTTPFITIGSGRWAACFVFSHVTVPKCPNSFECFLGSTISWKSTEKMPSSFPPPVAYLSCCKPDFKILMCCMCSCYPLFAIITGIKSPMFLKTCLPIRPQPIKCPLPGQWRRSRRCYILRCFLVDLWLNTHSRYWMGKTLSDPWKPNIGHYKKWEFGRGFYGVHVSFRGCT